MMDFFIVAISSVGITVILIVLGALGAAWLIGRGMMSVGNAPILGSSKGDAFTITDGTEQAFPFGKPAEEKEIKTMASEFLKSFTGRAM